MIPSTQPVLVPLTPERTQELLQLVLHTRRLQRKYRKSIDPRVRRLMEDSEFLLDRRLEEMTDPVLGLPAEKEGGAA